MNLKESHLREPSRLHHAPQVNRWWIWRIPMKTSNSFLAISLILLCLLSARLYAAESKETVAAAQKEGSLLIYSSTDSASVEPLLQDFKALYPFLRVEYNDLNTTEIYNRFVAETAAGTGTADFMWSSAMDLQI